MGSPVSVAGRYLLIAAALAASLYSVVLARASWLFREDTVNSVPAAVRLVPYDSEYLSRLAAWRTPEKVALLHRAVEFNPFDFQSLIHLGIEREFTSRDASGAERYYLRAAEVNKMFLPKWTLTNFYFRQQRTPEFFRWARATLAITPYAPEPVFIQMWLMSQDARTIARALPNRPRILLPYAWYLSNNHQFAPIPAIVQRLVDAVGKGDPRAWGRDGLLATIEDRLVENGDSGPALAVWGSLVRARWIDKEIPSASHPITNQDFGSRLYPHGFDWRVVPAEGVHVEQYASEQSLHLRFTGNEPETPTSLLEQYIPLSPGRTYHLKWQLESKLGDAASGLTWRVSSVGGVSHASLASQDIVLSSSTGWRFNAPPGSNLAKLSLEYARPYGHMRAVGTLILKEVSCQAE